MSSFPPWCSPTTWPRALGDKFQARWEQVEPGVVTTTMEIPALADLSIKLDAFRQIHNVARQVIDAFD